MQKYVTTSKNYTGWAKKNVPKIRSRETKIKGKF